MFSLRPEAIRLSDRPTDISAVRFRAMVRGRTFQGPTELLALECAGGLSIVARVPARTALGHEMDFEFFADDAVAVERGV